VSGDEYLHAFISSKALLFDEGRDRWMLVSP